MYLRCILVQGLKMNQTKSLTRAQTRANVQRIAHISGSSVRQSYAYGFLGSSLFVPNF